MQLEWFAFRSRAPRTCYVEMAGAEAAGGGDTSTATATADTSTADTSTATETATADANTQTTADSGTETQTTETGEGAETQTTEGETAEQSTDGVSAKLKGAIEAIKKTDPATAKAIKNLVYADAAFRKEFPGGLKEAQSLKAELSSLAGEDGLESLKQTVSAWKSIDERFGKGDPEVLKDFQKFNPESFNKIIPPAFEMLAESDPDAFSAAATSALDKLSQVNAEAYNHYQSGVFTATLDNYQIPATIANLVRSLSTIKDADGNLVASEEITSLQNVLKTIDGFRELAKKAPEPKKNEKTPVDTEKDAIAKEREAVQRERQEMRMAKIQEETTAYEEKQFGELIPKELEKFGAKLHKDGRAYQAIAKDAENFLVKEMFGDKEFTKNFNSLVAANKLADAVKLANSRFDRFAYNSVKKAVELWSRDFGKGKTNATTATPAAKAEAAKKPGVVKLDKAPAREEVDWERTTPQNYMFGKAYKKGDNTLYEF